MKKLLFLLLILSMYIHPASFNELEEAILEVNVEKFEMILKDVGSMSDLQKVAYANLAQYVIDNLNMENYIKKAQGGPESLLLLLGAGGIMCSSILIAIYFACDYEYKRDGLIKPVGVSLAVLSTFFASLVKGAHDEKEIQDAKKKKLRDSLYIKKKIYFS